MKDYRIKDLLENADGDLVLVNGDIATTDDQALDNVIQYIRTILATPFDFLPDESIGFDPTAFGGVPNTRENAHTIAESIKYAIIRDGYITPDSIAVEPIPISDTEVIFVITVTSMTDNGYQTIKLSTAFDTLNGKILTLRG